MNRETRDQIKRRYKEEVHPKGIYCVRSLTSGQVWVDSSTNLLSSENRLSFSLKTATLLNKELRAALAIAGPEDFEFEVLEIFDQDLSRLELTRQLKARRDHWQTVLSAGSLHR